MDLIPDQQQTYGNFCPENRWSDPTRYIMGVFLILAALAVVYIGRSSLALVVCAALLALLVDPVIRILN